MKHTFIFTAFLLLITLNAAFAQDATAVSDSLNVHNRRHLLTVSGAIYSGLPYIMDDNPAGYTQTYLRFNFLRPCIMDNIRSYPKRSADTSKKLTAHTGSGKSDTAQKYVAFGRNFFAQVLYSTNAQNLPAYINTKDTTDHVRYVNKLDLIKYANLRIEMLENLLTIYNGFDFKKDKNNHWENYFLVDGMATLMRTNISDSPATNTPINVNSWLLGVNTKATFKNYNNFTGKPISLEVAGQVLWVNPMTNTVNTDLNFQYENRNDYNTQLNPTTAKPLTLNPYMYYNIDFLAKLWIKNADTTATGDKKANSSHIFIHLGYTSNFALSTSPNFYNSYFVAQIGLGIDISSALSKLSTPKP